MSASKTAFMAPRNTARYLLVLALAFTLAIPLSTQVHRSNAFATNYDTVLTATPGWNLYGTCEYQLDPSTKTLTVRPVNGEEGYIPDFGMTYYDPGDTLEFEGRITIGCKPNNLPIKTIKGLSHLDTSKITDMSRFFAVCPNLESIDLSGFDTSSATDMSWMFEGCPKLKSVDFSGLDTSSVTTMLSMFQGCTSLEQVNFAGIDTSSVVDMASMFVSCPNLKSVDFSGLDTSSVTTMSRMLYGCTGLEQVNFAGLDTSSVADMFSMFDGCTNLRTIDLSGLDTSSVADMRWLLRNCRMLKSADLSRLDMSNIADISSMFAGCSSLEHVDLSGIDISNVTNMPFMFQNCVKLDSIDLSDLNASSVTNMTCMFEGCVSLKTADLTGIDTSSVTNMPNLFADCRNLEYVDLSSFDTAKVTSKAGMLFGCDNLTKIKVGSKFTLKNVFPAGNWRNEKGQIFTAATVPIAVAGTYEKTSVVPISSAKVSKASITYTGKAQKPAVRVTAGGKTLKVGSDYTVSYSNNTKVGTAKIVVKGKGAYSGTKTLTFKINPPTPAISKAKTAKKSFTAAWGTTSALKKSAAGYQVRYSATKSMKDAKIVTVKGSSKKSAKISKLKSGKKYYVQVRSYTKTGKATYYSGWSKVTTAKVK